MKEKEIQEFDEGVTAFLRTIPGFLWSFYRELVNQGFSESQALDLTKVHLAGQMGANGH